MRKVLLFLALFGIGLAALLLLRSHFRRPHSTGPSRVPQVSDSQFTQVPAPVEGPGKTQSPIDVFQKGAIDVTQFEEEGTVKRPLRTLKARDSNSLGGNVYVLTDMVAEDLDPKTGETKLRLVSPKTRLRISVVDGRLQIGELDKAVLTDVEGTIFGRSAVLPMKLTVPLLEWRFAERRWLSDSHVDITGAESSLVAKGEGLDADLNNGTVVLQHSGSIDLKLAGGTTATLAATGAGPIEFKDVREGDRDEIWITASEGARLSTEGTEFSRLDADKILIKAREASGGTKRFELVSADAEGKVVADSRGDKFRADKAAFRLTPAGRLEAAELEGSVSLESVEGSVKGAKATFGFSSTGGLEKAHIERDVDITHGEDRFRADTADFAFGAEGKLASADLAGSPSGTIAIGRYLPAGERELRAARPQISGQGPMHLDLAAGTKVSMRGPGRISAPEIALEITAEKTLEGSATEDRTSGDFAAIGAATVKWKEDDLSADEVRIEARASETGETVVTTKGIGPTTVHRKREDGSTLTMKASGGLETVSQGGRTVVRRADGVTLESTGPEGFTASAASVRDFDWEAQTFTAEGDVSLNGARGSGFAERAISRGPNDLELVGAEAANGAPAKPARYARRSGEGETRFDEASIQGRTIRATDTTLDAVGNVRLDVAGTAQTYHLQGGEVHATFQPPSGPEPGAPQPFEAHAQSAVRVQIDSSQGASSVACESLRLRGTTKGGLRGGAPLKVEEPDVRAEGSVVVDWQGKGGVTGTGDLFTMDPDGRGQLTADPGKRVHAQGRRIGDVAPYSLDADWFEFDEQRLEARKVEMRLEPSLAGAAAISGKPYIGGMSADHILVTPIQALLEGNAHVQGRTSQGEEWSVDAASVKMIGDFAIAKKGKAPDLESVQAWGGFKAQLAGRAHAQGETLDGNRGKVRLEGTPEKPAEVEFGRMRLRSPWIEYDAKDMLLATDKGEVGPAETPGAKKPSWTIDYESLQPFVREDKSILALRNPVLHSGETQVRAFWMLLWLDREEWRKSGRKAVSETTGGPELRVEAPETPQTPQTPSGPAKKKEAAPDDSRQKRLAKLRADIARFRADPFYKVLSEAYIEGNVELTESGERTARASALYLDFVDGHGWVRDADVIEDVSMRGRPQRLRVSAEWMRVSADLSIRADKATLTFCSYDEPHYVVETGDLRLRPNGAGVRDFDVSATNNALRFENGWAIPLPPILYAKDEEGNPIIENLSLGKSAKFGASIGATFNVGLGKIGNGFGHLFSGLLSLPKTSMKGHWSFHADYLGLRGILLGTGLELRSSDKFWFNGELSVIPDGGEDRGLVRVPEDERSFLREWFRARARYSPTKSEWFDLALSYQSDPGVQSEFFEGNYLHYEQKDNYLHWRRAEGEWLFSSSAKVLLEDRTDTEELPKAGVFRGRAPVGDLLGLDLLYTGSLDGGYFRRHDGDPEFYAPFPDGLGDVEVARVDTEHKIEAPFSFGFLGLRGTPWTSLRATAWDRGENPDTSPSRAAALVGFDVSTTFWKRYGRFLNTISPFASVHGDVASEEVDGEPVFIDRTEAPIEGRFVDLGLRTRIWSPTTQQHFDAEVRATHGSNLPNGQPDGLQPVSVLGEFLTWVGSVPVGMLHDGRYDVEDDRTVYSRTFLGFRPVSKWDIEFGYHRGVDPAGVVLYEAASAATRYRATDKWELELAETTSLFDDRNLASTFTLRRLGHDFVTEIQTSYTAGEGSSFSINLLPLVQWKPTTIGLLDRWLGR
jgi:hypothetical protein